MLHHGQNIDIIDYLTLVEIEKIEYHTFANLNLPLAHPLNSIILMKSESLVSLFESSNNMKNITLDPLASSGVKGTISMQPQMVAGGYQNILGIHNCFQGSTFWGNPLPWNFNITGVNNASYRKNSNWIYIS